MPPEVFISGYATAAMVPSITAILNESTSVPPRRSPKTFHCRNLFVFPIIIAMLVQHGPRLFNSSHATELLPFLCYLDFLFTFPPLSAALILTVTFYYASEPVSAVPSSVLIKRFFVAYLWVSLIMATYNVAFLGCYVLSMVAKVTRNPAPLLALALFGVICLSSADDASLCWLVGVVSGLEPVYGFVAMEKCYVLLKARNPVAARLVFAYLLVYGSIGGVYGSSVLHGGLDYGVIVMYLLGGCLVGWSVVLILLGRMVRCVLSSSDFCH